MFSISFLPWLLLLLGILLSVPIVSYLETSRQKKALAAAATPVAAEEEGYGAEGAEVFGNDVGFSDDGGFASGGAVAAGGRSGKAGDAELAGFDDDPFK